MALPGLFMYRRKPPSSNGIVGCIGIDSPTRGHEFSVWNSIFFFFFVADLARTSWTWAFFMGFLRCEGSISGVFFRSVDSFLTIDAFVLRRRIVARTTSLNGAAFQTRRTKTDWRPTSSAKKFHQFYLHYMVPEENNLQTLEIGTSKYFPSRITF